MDRYEDVTSMDKTYRVLLLYSKLIKGEFVNKLSFCMETDTNPRSFDRDIEDLRNYLSDSYSMQDIIYERDQNCYVLSGMIRQELEMTEYRFIERILSQIKVLSIYELKGILLQLASNTEKPRECLMTINSCIEDYPRHLNTPLLKMHDDISYAIRNKNVILIQYRESLKVIVEKRLIPYDIEYKRGKMFLLGILEKNETLIPQYYELNRIISFKNLSGLSLSTWYEVTNIIKKYRTNKKSSESNIVIKCQSKFLDELVRQNFEVIKYREKDNSIIVTIVSDEDKFVEWIMGQDVSRYYVCGPPKIKETIRKKAQELFKCYVKE